MRSSNILFGALLILGVAFLGAYYWYQTQPDPATAAPVVAGDVDGPTMDITVKGVANGHILVKLFADVAPQHVERIKELVESGAYDNVVFHRVIDGFMAQTGDVQYGKADGDNSRAGQGASEMPDLPAEFSSLPFDRGMVGMARSASPNSANSQFFIMFAPAPHLNGQYTVVGQVVEGMDVLDAIKRGSGGNGEVDGDPDVMASVTLIE
ncbi:MAG: peptidylprolyl isomerase [Paracoccaceae bacterium]